MFLLVPAYPRCPGQTAVKWLLLMVRGRTRSFFASVRFIDHARGIMFSGCPSVCESVYACLLAGTKAFSDNVWFGSIVHI